jgi:hypothetical protein
MEEVNALLTTERLPGRTRGRATRRHSWRTLRTLAILTVIACSSEGAALGDIIYSSFGPGYFYSPYIAGWTVQGSDFGFVQTAMAFTPSADYLLTQLDVAISYAGAGGDSVVLSFSGDIGGLPGQPLETWILKDLPSYGTCCVVETLTLDSMLSLDRGTQYWLVASPEGPGDRAVWDIDDLGQMGSLSQTLTPDLFSGINFSSMGAFDAQGTLTSSYGGPLVAPEPSTFVTLLGGLLLTGVWALSGARPPE